MHQYPAIITVNKRKVKKALQRSGTSVLHSTRCADSYEGVFVVCGIQGDGYLCVQHAPKSENHNRTRFVPHCFTKCIKGNKHLL